MHTRREESSLTMLISRTWEKDQGSSIEKKPQWPYSNALQKQASMTKGALKEEDVMLSSLSLIHGLGPKLVHFSWTRCLGIFAMMLGTTWWSVCLALW